MKKSMDKKLLTFYLWLALGYFLLGFFTTIGTYPDKFFADVFNNIWGVVYVTIVNFILFEYSVRFVLRKRKTIIYNILIGILLGFLYMIVYSYGSYLWRLLGIQLHIYTQLKIYASLDAALQNQMAYSVGSVFLFGVSRHIYNYIKLKQAEQTLRIQKQEAELSYLRSQTNPHFLFNTLNNIYSLARDKSDLAPESIMRLSKILRFNLYEASGAYIAIEQELKIISDYIALEKLRYDESLHINFNYDVEDMKQALPPLLLIPLVENAFKHGVSETRNRPFVDIHLTVKNRHLMFLVKNSTDVNDEEKNVKENIGLSNLRRQLELLYTDYNLSVQQGESVFTATLKINLSSHV
ncbi:MAG: histidine kinase [Parafilimonas sp.]|nr:histidine kinase [Parafilimonas sp.]